MEITALIGLHLIPGDTDNDQMIFPFPSAHCTLHGRLGPHLPVLSVLTLEKLKLHLISLPL